MFFGSADCKGVREFEAQPCEDWAGGQVGAQRCCARTTAEQTGGTFSTRLGFLGRGDGCGSRGRRRPKGTAAGKRS